MDDISNLLNNVDEHNNNNINNFLLNIDISNHSNNINIPLNELNNLRPPF